MTKNWSESTGIQGFSGPLATDHFVIFAANKHLANHVSAWLSLNVSFFRPLIGAYKGKQENSWIIRADEFDTVKPLLDGEESILHLGTMNSRGDRKAKLIFMDGSPDVSLGWFRETTKEKAFASEAYTMDFNHVNGKALSRYWTCVMLDIFGEE